MRIFSIAILLFAIANFAFAQQLSLVGKGYSKTSVNTTVFRCNSIVSLADTQFVAYYDSAGFVTVAKRNLQSDEWTVQRTQYRGNCADAHNVISLGIDADGYIHLAFDHHNNALHYTRSVAPFALQFDTLMTMIGRDEQSVTYPEFHRSPDGQLFFVYRDGGSGHGNMILNRYDTVTCQWQRIQSSLLDGQGQRSAYWQMCIDTRGVIHLSWVWRETWMVETNHDLCYAFSADGGATWQRSDSTIYELPITAQNAEIACRIPQNSELINQTGMSADADGNPYIATYWRNSGDSIPQYRLVYRDATGWISEQTSNRQMPFSLSGSGTKMIPVARPKVVVDDDGTIIYIFRDVERGSRVSAFINNSSTKKCTIVDLTDFAVDAWEPSFDVDLWNDKRRLQLFVQQTFQGDGERSIDAEATPIYILEIL